MSGGNETRECHIVRHDGRGGLVVQTVVTTCSTPAPTTRCTTQAKTENGVGLQFVDEACADDPTMGPW
jgi:hypothetical protein